MALLLAALVWHPAAMARPVRPSAAENFPIGASGDVCEGQGSKLGDARSSIFDRKWALICRDIATPIGTAYALRGGSAQLAAVQRQREESLDCSASGAVAVPGIGFANTRRCRAKTSGMEWVLMTRQKGNTLYAVEGYAGYEDVLRLALATLVQDRVQAVEVKVATLGTDESGMMIHAMAKSSDIDTIIGEGYRGNNAGAYGEAAKLFAAAPALIDTNDGKDSSENESRLHDVMVNQALQLSNLGSFEQAAQLFAKARKIATRDPVQTRLGRNFEAIDAINRGDLAAVGPILDRPMPPMAAPSDASGRSVTIDRPTAAGLNASNGQVLAGVLGQETRLSPKERAMIIDAQALELRGTVLRLEGKGDAARTQLKEAYDNALKVRDGRVVSIARLRSQVLSEIAASYEDEGHNDQAEALLRQALDLVEGQYPDSATVNATRARLAGFLIRHGRENEAAGIYRAIVRNVSGSREALVGMTNLMRPWFDLLSKSAGSDPQAAAELFAASQLVERPGAADTLAQLARQLEGENSEASDLFRRSLNITRELERTRVNLARANAELAQGGRPQGLDDLRQEADRLAGAQAELLNALSAFPQYRAVARRTATADEMRATLRAGEAYLKLARLGDALYATYITPKEVRGWKVGKSAKAIADEVANLRDSISVTVNGVQSTYPFAIDAAVELYGDMVGPIAGELPSVQNLVFEPDGAMLQLPINLLTGDKKGVAAYHARVEAGGDEYDFTGIDWLGRDRAISTALSAASFRDARQAPSSKAKRAYLGLGQNKPLGLVTHLPEPRGTQRDATGAGCSWPVAAWNQPISADELRDASGLFSGERPDVMTGADFSDTAIMARKDLDEFRILHFATHGFVTPPHQGCPARPALLTSFGRGNSDGLLSFREIFDLNLDADLVILSACDTAGQASIETTLEAGVSTGGGQAFDGLVRAFLAAGGRNVIATHWPAPDDYGATRRLFEGVFTDSKDDIGQALRKAQIVLMDDPETSHPFYWAGFAIVGDGARPLPGR